MKRLLAAVCVLFLCLSALGCQTAAKGKTEVSWNGGTTLTEQADFPSDTTTFTGDTTLSTSETTTTTDTTVTTTAPATTLTTISPTAKPTTTTKKTTVTVKKTTTSKSKESVQTAELRGMWVSFIEVNRLLKNTTIKQTKAAIDTMMDRCVSYQMNAVFLHVRANSDAYYASKLFKPAAVAAPLLQGGFDPLSYAVSAAHKRHLQLHAWVNPYRIGADASYAVKGMESFFFQDRYYYVPTSAPVRKLILDGVRELVENYAIDGVQFDDYFYREHCVEANAPATFETDAFAAYQKSGGRLNVSAWRHANVDLLVSSTYALVHKKTNCVFGISPSFDEETTYKLMYADPVKWLAESGYVDYLCPQLYFGFLHETAGFDRMVKKWTGFRRASSVKLYFGLAAYRAGSPDADKYAGEAGKYEWAQSTDLLKREVKCVRSSGIKGMLFYSYTYFEPSATNPKAVQEINNLLTELKH